MHGRRERFRDYMARLDGAADPVKAVERGFYVERAASLAQRIALRLDLKPASSQLIVGGIGTGKTTQLLVARQRWAAEHPGAIGLYVDLSEHQDLDRLVPGSLMALVGLMLSEHIQHPAAEEVCESFKHWAHGIWIDPWDDIQNGTDYVFKPGVVIPPRAALDRRLQRKQTELRKFLTTACADQEEHEIVIFIDSLDRVSDMQSFQTLVTQDVVALNAIGIGLVLVGPLRALYGLERVVADAFDHVYRQPAFEVAANTPERAFLVEILRKRAPSDMLGDAECEALASWSGGVLRDLIRLAHQAAEEAYMSGADSIDDRHIARAADAFGRSLMIGLTSEDTDKLREVHRTGRFVETSERDLALLVTRRILDYEAETGLRYAIHPTLVPHIAGLSVAPGAEAS
jgi:hypothetical protein